MVTIKDVKPFTEKRKRDPYTSKGRKPRTTSRKRFLEYLKTKQKVIIRESRMIAIFCSPLGAAKHIH
jgi:hypothetical protein